MENEPASVFKAPYTWTFGDPELKLDVDRSVLQFTIADRTPDLDKELFLRLTKDYMRYRMSGSRTLVPGIPRRRVLTRKSGISLCMGNSRFLLGLVNQLTEGQPYGVSLDLLTQTVVVEAVIECLKLRGTKSARLYQLMLEVRTILAFLLESMRLAADASERHKFVPDVIPSYVMVHNLVGETSRGRKLIDKQNLVQGQEALAAKGRWLSAEDAAILVECLEEYLMEKVTRHADETQRPTDGEAFAFQNHLLLYLFAGNVIPVPRVQCFLKLKLNQELKFDVARDRYTIEILDLSESKVAMPAILNIPATVTPWMHKWIRFFRPALLALSQASHAYVWVKRDGTAPRASLNAVFKSTMAKYIDGRACPQSFRHMQATESKRLGASSLESKAMCQGRQHSEKTAERYYERLNLDQMAEAAEHHLAQVRSAQKRARDPSPSAHPMPPRPSVAESASFQVPAWERSNRARLSGGQLPVQAPADVSGPIVID